MTKEQVKIVECATKGLKEETWWDCEGCPAIVECHESIDDPPCEVALFEMIKMVKKLCEK